MSAVHPLAYLAVLGVSSVVGLFVAGPFGAAIGVVLGLALFAATVDDIEGESDT